jgi:two-component system, NarL family, response regulator NreC
VIGEAADAPAAQKLVRDRRPDVLVLDLQMPGAEPTSDVPALREEAPETAIVVLTMESDPRRARELLQGGASGYVLKQAAERQLTAAIRTVAEGGSYIDPELGGQVAQLGDDPLQALSERDRELLRLLALGHTNREIGERLYLSVRAVEVNRAKLMGRLELESRPELVRFAIANGLIEAGGASPPAAAPGR